MKIIKKISLSLLLGLFLISSLNVPTTNAATVKLNKKAVTIYNTKSYTLKVIGTSNKAKWSTSNKSVATVDSKGKVTGKKVGKATITCKVAGKTLQAAINVKKYSSFKLNKTSLKFTSKKAKTVILTDLSNGKSTFTCEPDSGVACKWGNWKNDQIKLSITPKTSGTFKIRVFDSKKPNDLKTITATVTGVKENIKKLIEVEWSPNHTGTLADYSKVSIINRATKPLKINWSGFSVNGYSMFPCTNPYDAVNTVIDEDVVLESNYSYFSYLSDLKYKRYVDVNSELVFWVEYEGETERIRVNYYGKILE